MVGIVCDVRISNNDATSISRLSLFSARKAAELPINLSNDKIRLIEIDGQKLATTSVRNIRQGHPVNWATMEKFRAAIDVLIERGELEESYRISPEDVIAIAFRFRNIPKALEAAGFDLNAVSDADRINKAMAVIGPVESVKAYMIRSACEGRPLPLVAALAIWETVCAKITDHIAQVSPSIENQEIIDNRVTGAPDDFITASASGFERNLGPVDYDVEDNRFILADLVAAPAEGHPWARLDSNS